MNYIFTGRNIEVTNALKDQVEKKFAKLSKYFKENTDVHVTFSTQKGSQRIEVTIPMKGTTIRAEEETDDMFATIDLLREVLERQLRRNRKKLIERRQEGIALSDLFFTEDTEVNEDVPIKIVKTKQFALKPMDAEEACFEMDLSGHNFYVFRNSATEEVNVVYKRKDGNYGLIEPEC